MIRAGNEEIATDYTALRQNVVPAGLAICDAVLAISLSETASWFRYLPSVAGKTVCISGTGIAGLSMVLWSLLAGAETIIILGRRDERIDLALKIGATHGINVTRDSVAPAVREINGGRGADFFLEAVGLPDQVELGLSMLSPGGTVAIYGVPEGQRYDLSWGRGSGHASICQFPAEEHLAYGWVARLMGRSLIPTQTLMTHHWPLDQFREAFDAVASGAVVKGWIEL
jgi:threonine dehydrogenase-like Zn-dependent dehydrogenase